MENILGFRSVEKSDNLASITSRAEAEVQASYVVAKRFPRSENESFLRIIESCKRPFLAEQAMYAYPRGGKLVTGPSIRLAESMAQAWGNLDCGIKEISQCNGVSIAEAYAIDLQTNTRVAKIFHVPHIRDTKKGAVRLTESRDIYELVANQGARRLRACVLGILPGDVVEAAVNQCKKTLGGGDVPLSDRIRAMVTRFDEVGVKIEHLEKRLCHKLEATTAEELVTLTGVYKSIKDGFGKREDFFEIGTKQDNKTIAKETIKKLQNRSKQNDGEEICKEAIEFFGEENDGSGGVGDA